MLKLFCKSCSVGSFSNHRHLLDLIKKQGTPKWHLANLDVDWSVNNRLPYAFGTESQISSFCFIKVLCHKMWGTWYWCTKGHYYCDRISSFIESTYCGCTELNLSINLHTHILVSVNGRLHANHQGWALRANLASIRKSYWVLQCSFGCVCACVRQTKTLSLIDLTWYPATDVYDRAHRKPWMSAYKYRYYMTIYELFKFKQK